jgi:cell division protein FtsB
MEKVIFRSKKEKREVGGAINPLNILVQFSLLAISLFLLYNIARSIQITTLKLEILKQAEREVDQLRVENIELILKKGTFQSADYIETEARNRLNYSQKGEILFVIPDSSMDSAALELERILSGAEQAEAIKRAVWEKWYDFFLLGV